MACLVGSDAAPRVAAQAQGFADVPGAPIKRNGPALQPGQALDVPAGPGQEGVAAAVAPDFNSGTGVAALAARMKARRVGNDQSIFLDGEGSRLGIAHAVEGRPGNPQGTPRAQTVQRAGFHGLAPQPGKPAAVDPVRAGHIDEGAIVRPHVGQEQPGLDRGMERVGMQLDLRVGRRSLVHARQDGLQIVHGMAPERTGIAEQPEPGRALQQMPCRGHVLERPGVQRHAAGDGVALRHLAHLALGAGQFFLDRGQDFRGQKVRLEDESVAVEVAAILLAQQMPEPFAPEVRHAVRQPDARDVQAGPVQRGAAEDGIVFEGFGFGRQRQQPHRRAQPTQRVRGARKDGRRWRLGRFLWHVA